MDTVEYDYVIIGSGFGGSVSALRLSEKGYKVLIVEKGKWFSKDDFPKTNLQLRKWLWEPILGMYGIFKMTYLNHVTVVHGVGVGGGSLTYANTLPIPKSEFFTSGSWGSLADWETELKSHYTKAYQMLGADINPKLFDADKAVQQLAKDLNIKDRFEPTKVGVYFGEPGKTVKDPYFNGEGPERSGCIFCGACMTGCKHNAKNTLDKNYLYLAQKKGATIIAEKEVFNITLQQKDDSCPTYEVHYKNSMGFLKRKHKVTAKGIIFSGGVLGTVPLLLKLKKTRSLPNLSDNVGSQIRTNNEALVLVTSTSDDTKDFSKGLAIGSILDVDENSHLEPTRYGKGSGFFKFLTIPLSYNSNPVIRIFSLVGLVFKQPIRLFKTMFLADYSTKTTILLFMQTLDSTLRLKLGKITRMKTVKEKGPAPNAFIPEAKALGDHFARNVKGIPYASVTDVLLGNPTTAHILGGAVMGEDSSSGVIDKDNRVFGYKNIYVCDGSMISANPGVNPALSITAISELAMSKIPEKRKKN